MPTNILVSSLQCVHATHAEANKLAGNSFLRSRSSLPSHRNNTRCFGRSGRLQNRPSRLVGAIPSAASSESQVAPPQAKSTKLKYGDRYVSLISILKMLYYRISP
jgi:hypothetical protein